MKGWEWDAFHVGCFQGKCSFPIAKAEKRGVLLISDTDFVLKKNKIKSIRGILKLSETFYKLFGQIIPQDKSISDLKTRLWLKQRRNMIISLLSLT